MTYNCADYRILHDAGYNVLAYDLRNFGHSGSANGGIASSGIFEARDVLGSLKYVRSRDDTRHMAVGLFSRCLGCSATFRAMADDREAFKNVRCLVGPQPVTMKIIVERRLVLMGVPASRIADHRRGRTACDQVAGVALGLTPRRRLSHPTR